MNHIHVVRKSIKVCTLIPFLSLSASGEASTIEDLSTIFLTWLSVFFVCLPRALMILRLPFRILFLIVSFGNSYSRIDVVISKYVIRFLSHSRSRQL